MVDAPHTPVLLDEVLEVLAPRSGEQYIDATFGAGGYTRAILGAADCCVVGVDRDPSAVEAAVAMEGEFPRRFELRLAPFSDLRKWAEDPDSGSAFIGAFDGVVFDLGVSSMQLDEASRGFSFLHDGPLDMRMFSVGGSVAGGDVGGMERGPSAADVVNGHSELDLADIIFQLGEEKRSRGIARAIVARREVEPFARTLDLAQVVETAVGGRRGSARHPATKTFQALRMFVNDELRQLLNGLHGAERLLKPGGRLVVVTFHSLEDRIVKRFLAHRSGRKSGVSRHLPSAEDQGPRPSFQIVNHRSLTSSKGEIEVNPRARSARLRWALRSEAAAFAADFSNLGVPGVAR